MWPRLLFALPVVAIACGAGEPESKRLLVVDESASDVTVIGVLPEQFQCGSVAPGPELEAIIGSFEAVSSPFDVGEGLAAPCNYVTRSADAEAQWSFDLDCRDRALDDGKSLMVQYATDGDARPVRVGTSGIDYRDAALLFIDDDSPCYARVLGPTAAGRLALARLVADNLDASSAPTSLRYQRAASTHR